MKRLQLKKLTVALVVAGICSVSHGTIPHQVSYNLAENTITPTKLAQQDCRTCQEIHEASYLLQIMLSGVAGADFLHRYHIKAKLVDELYKQYKDNLSTVVNADLNGNNRTNYFHQVDYQHLSRVVPSAESSTLLQSLSMPFSVINSSVSTIGASVLNSSIIPSISFSSLLLDFVLMTTSIVPLSVSSISLTSITSGDMILSSALISSSLAISTSSSMSSLSLGTTSTSVVSSLLSSSIAGQNISSSVLILVPLSLLGPLNLSFDVLSSTTGMSSALSSTVILPSFTGFIVPTSLLVSSSANMISSAGLSSVAAIPSSLLSIPTSISVVGPRIFSLIPSSASVLSVSSAIPSLALLIPTSAFSSVTPASGLAGVFSSSLANSALIALLPTSSLLSGSLLSLVSYISIGGSSALSLSSISATTTSLIASSTSASGSWMLWHIGSVLGMGASIPASVPGIISTGLIASISVPLTLLATLPSSALFSIGSSALWGLPIESLMIIGGGTLGAGILSSALSIVWPFYSMIGGSGLVLVGSSTSSSVVGIFIISSGISLFSAIIPTLLYMFSTIFLGPTVLNSILGFGSGIPIYGSSSIASLNTPSFLLGSSSATLPISSMASIGLDLLLGSASSGGSFALSGLIVSFGSLKITSVLPSVGGSFITSGTSAIASSATSSLLSNLNSSVLVPSSASVLLSSPVLELSSMVILSLISLDIVTTTSLSIASSGQLSSSVSAPLVFLSLATSITSSLSYLTSTSLLVAPVGISLFSILPIGSMGTVPMALSSGGMYFGSVVSVLLQPSLSFSYVSTVVSLSSISGLLSLTTVPNVLWFSSNTILSGLGVFSSLYSDVTIISSSIFSSLNVSVLPLFSSSSSFSVPAVSSISTGGSSLLLVSPSLMILGVASNSSVISTFSLVPMMASSIGVIFGIGSIAATATSMGGLVYLV